MEERWEVLRLCKNHWKAQKVANQNYSNWYSTYRKAPANDNKNRGKNKASEEPPKKRVKPSTSTADTEDESSPTPETHTSEREILVGRNEDIDSAQLKFRSMTDSLVAISPTTSRPKARPLIDPL